MSFNILQTYMIRSFQYLACTFNTSTISFDVMDFQSVSKLKKSKCTYKYVSRYVQIYRSYISPNQNICNQTLSNFARFPESGDKFANMATLGAFISIHFRLVIRPTTVSIKQQISRKAEPSSDDSWNNNLHEMGRANCTLDPTNVRKSISVAVKLCTRVGEFWE